MKNVITLLVVAIVFNSSAYGQDDKLEVEGAIQIGNTEDPNPDPGTIRWTGSDFMGWNGSRWVSLTTVVSYGAMINDIDGNKYLTVQIGSQEWMAEDLRTSTYNTGAAIPNVTDDGQWSGLSTGAWCYYMNDGNTYGEVYGKLYNWFAVSDSLCPTGWHVPTSAEWNTLYTGLGTTGVAGGKMKEAGLSHWDSPNTGASNESGFTGLPAGRRNVGGSFQDEGAATTYWSAASTNATDAWATGLNFNQNALGIDPNSKKAVGYSIRCV